MIRDDPWRKAGDEVAGISEDILRAFAADASAAARLGGRRVPVFRMPRGAAARPEGEESTLPRRVFDTI